MAAVLKRIGLGGNISTSLVIHHLKRLSPSRKLSLSNCSLYSTESASSTTEEFSLRYLEGKHEGNKDKLKFIFSLFYMFQSFISTLNYLFIARREQVF